MDIFIQQVPEHVNHVELRKSLQDKLRRFGILAFDLFKKTGNNWAIVTVAVSENGQNFLKHYGARARQPLTFGFIALHCKVSNKRPDPLKVVSLLQREEEIRSRRVHQPNAGSPQPIFPFQSLATGVWVYDQLDQLVFDQKYRDLRVGSVTFGRHALVIYLETSNAHGFAWHGRIDIPYAIVEHTIPFTENGTRGSITLTLKSPPKIYEIVSTDDIHLYTGRQAIAVPSALSMLAGMSLGGPSNGRRVAKLERLCNLHEQHDKHPALCMVYKIMFQNLNTIYQVWAFIKEYSVPEPHCWKLARSAFTSAIEFEMTSFEAALAASKLSFAERFQSLALVLEGTLTPQAMLGLISTVESVSEAHGSKFAALAVRYLGRQIPTPGPHVAFEKFTMKNHKEALWTNVRDAQQEELTRTTLHGKRKQQQHLALTYKATITPTGMVLRGPDWTVSNRILRKYAKHSDSFMRVLFADEDGMSVFYDAKSSQIKVYERFRKVLREGIWIAGRHFEFLGFSHASLRDHQTWFMSPIVVDGRTINARDVIAELGDFSNIRCSAKCAARIGQAFSDTIFAVHIPDDALATETKDDVVRNGRTFSDGCGTMSLQLFKHFWKALPPDRRSKRPTVLQIRYRGAKGVLSLDSSLLGKRLEVRKSMTKYIAKEEWRDLELCGAAYKPLRMYLNHQFIKILEDLGVPLADFISVQNEARRELEMVIKHPINAASFLEYSHSGVHAKIPRLFRLMHYIGLSFQADRFLTDIVEVAAMANLRSLKYRARIPIEKGYLLYGIMDETNYLKEGQVYIVTEDDVDDGRRERHVLLGDRIVVTRAPALHPGDVQVVKAVDVPDNSPLKDLHNCIVFSQQGARDLPSQLSGGDLDGDLFHIICDTRLTPPTTYAPADYAPAKPLDLGRPVHVNDIVDFFIEFMNMDRLGQISNMHKIRADLKPAGTMDPDCIMLAKLASDAVDFSKSGIPADLRQVPKGKDHIRPDFMAPGPNLVVNAVGRAELEELQEEDIDDPDSVSVLDPEKSRIRYYRSPKVLGHLYRNIDEKKFFSRMKDDFEAMHDRLNDGTSLIQKLERYIDRETRGYQWEHHRVFAEELREYYEQNMVNIMDTMRAHRSAPLTELEVFSGNILGKKERASTRYIREANQEVQERFDRDVSVMIRSIVQGDDDEFEDGEWVEALPRSVACFKVALETKGWENWYKLKSWKYVAASVCLEQVWRLRKLRLPPL